MLPELIERISEIPGLFVDASFHVGIFSSGCNVPQQFESLCSGIINREIGKAAKRGPDEFSITFTGDTEAFNAANSHANPQTINNGITILNLTTISGRQAFKFGFSKFECFHKHSIPSDQGILRIACFSLGYL